MSRERTSMHRRMQRLEISGSAGPLETLLDWPGAPVRAAALLCHPHPLHGGTMHTKALARVARALVEAGAATLRFNFRGVGRSAGDFSGGEGEEDDAARALATLVERVAEVPLFLGGFSFGSFIALRLGSPPGGVERLRGLIGIAPPLSLFDFSFLEGLKLPILLVAGDQDPFCPIGPLEALTRRLGSSAQLQVLPGTGHLLLESLDALEDVVMRFTRELTEPPPSATP